MNLWKYIIAKKHHQFRHKVDWNLASEYKTRGLSPAERMTGRFNRLCAAERPVFLPDEKICFLRTVQNIPDIFTKEEWDEIRAKHFIHELGYISNLCADFEGMIRDGIQKRLEGADALSRSSAEALLSLTDRYQKEAAAQGKDEIAAVLARVPRYGARNFREALQSFRILHFGLWLEGNYHNTTGRFDKYMWPYLKTDMEKGLYTEESALELVEDFFLSFNKDSDLYPGVQQGDNGQSMVLGGVDEDGTPQFNLLSKLCLRASENLKLIDPKINLRVNKNTPVEIYEMGTCLTKAGLGFPQYTNDDVMIPGLERLGYEHPDAANYAIAACWELIIPKAAMDVVNIGALSFPKVVDRAFHKSLKSSAAFDDFMAAVRKEVFAEADIIAGGIKDLWFIPSPFLNVFMGRNIAEGAKYNNFGIHGTGIATAADSLAAIQKYVYDEKTIDKDAYIEAVDSDFRQHGEFLSLLRQEAPKMGQDDDRVDRLGIQLLDWFTESFRGRRNCRGGLFRPGTGSAMYYLWHANEIGASPDGRRKGEPFGANFSASLFAGIPGPFSVIKSFTKFSFDYAVNGGPLTLEFNHQMFSSPESMAKIARLVKGFIDRGGHQLQLNAVNPEQMKDAQVHPGEHRQLVVRVWGWSAYFVELDKAYQDHVIARQEYRV
jgi:formate C-acetyltransferase